MSTPSAGHPWRRFRGLATVIPMQGFDWAPAERQMKAEIERYGWPGDEEWGALPVPRVLAGYRDEETADESALHAV